MEESFSTQYTDDLKALTIELQKRFSSENSEDNIKWSLLKEYHSKFLLKKDFNQTVTASYMTVLSALSDSLRNNLFTQKWQETLFDDIFLQGIHHEAFLILIKRLEENEGFVEQKIISLLLKFAQGSSLEAMLIYQCVSHKDWVLKYVSKSKFWDDLITAIVSLPERIANQTKGKFIKLFSPSSYIPLLLYSIFKVLLRIHDRLRNSQDCSLEFLAKLTGRLCSNGNADLVAKKFSKQLIKVSELNFVWRRISQNFITKMPSSSLDSFITSLLLAVPWYGYVEWILGDEGARNEKINFIMTDKLVFNRPFKQVIILQNAIGYFASSSGRLPHFMSILNSLLDSWMDEITFRHQSIEHKMYIASALMICAGWVRHLKLGFDNKAYINKVLKGTQIRLGSSEDTVRSLGMIVGEQLIKSIDPDSPPLKFEFSDTAVLNHIKNLLDIPSKPVDDTVSIDELKWFEELEPEKSKENSSFKNENSYVSNKNEELDSDDDDLNPYDLSDDISNEGAKHPFYLRECMIGLVEQQNAEWTEQCMKHAEELIKTNAYATEEVYALIIPELYIYYCIYLSTIM